MNDKTMWLILGGIAIVFVIGFFFMGNNRNETESTDNAMEETAMEKETEKDAMMEAEKEVDVMVADTPTIVEIAASNPDFSTLVTAVQAAELVDTLSGPGPFTVFAPTNAAFEALPDGTLEAVLADQEQLTDILTYHVVAGKVMAEDVVNLTEAQTVQGGTIDITVTEDGAVLVNEATVVSTDIEGSNGVIHVIDAVLLPE